MTSDVLITPPSPVLDPRRTEEFRDELLARAAAWIPGWSIEQADFGAALLQVAARFNAEVAEQLDRVPQKQSLGLLDWLGYKGDAAVAARMPVVFKLTDSVQRAVLANAPVQLQAAAGDVSVIFETEADLLVAPGVIDTFIAADPASDRYFLPPPNLFGISPEAPGPTQWQLKAFAKPDTVTLQLDPAEGLNVGTLLAAAGTQYRITAVTGDVVTVTPPVVPSTGLAKGALLEVVKSFAPFEAGPVNQQSHAVYIGATDLLDINAKAVIEIVGAAQLPADIDWQWWGKLAGDDGSEDDWRDLLVGKADGSALSFTKPPGAMDVTAVNGISSRWLRGIVQTVDSEQLPLTTDSLKLRINPPLPPGSPVPAALDPAQYPLVEVVYNTVPLPSTDFYPLGRAPRLFDTFYVGCNEAFSKPGATANINFAIADASFDFLAVVNAPGFGGVLAAVGTAGNLVCYGITLDGSLQRRDVGDAQPKASHSASPVPLTSSSYPPVIWADKTPFSFGTQARIAVCSADAVWLRTLALPLTSPFLLPFGLGSAPAWKSLGSPLSGSGPPSPISGLVGVTVNNGGAPGQAPAFLVALRNGTLSQLSNPQNNVGPWLPVAVFLPDPVKALAAVRPDPKVAAGPQSAGFIALTTDANVPPVSSLYYVDLLNLAAPTLLLSNVAPGVIPYACYDHGHVDVVAIREDGAALLARQLVLGGVGFAPKPPQLVDGALTLGMLDARIEDGQLAVYAVAADGLIAWRPFDTTATPFDQAVKFPADRTVGQLSGSIVLNGGRGYGVGDSPGQLIGVDLTGPRIVRSIVAGNCVSALKVAHADSAPNVGDLVSAVDSAMAQVFSKLVIGPLSGFRGSADSTFAWLDKRWIPLAGNNPRIYGKGPVGLIWNLANPQQLVFAATLPVAAGDTFVISSAAGNNFQFVTVTGVVAANTATLQAAPAGLIDGGALDYWLLSPTPAKLVGAMNLDASNNDWDASLVQRCAITFNSAVAKSQNVAAAVVAASSVTNMALESGWTQALPASVAFMLNATVSSWSNLLQDNGSNPALAWEYWTGSAWWALTIKDDGTGNLKRSGAVSFNVPTILATEVSGKSDHWVRARLIGGDYGTETVVVKSTVVSSTETDQTVIRSTDGIQPPHVLSLWVDYQIEQPVTPDYLLSFDSGSYLDQSDANATDGPQITFFTPMTKTFVSLEQAPAAPPATGAGCECNAAPPAAATVAVPGADDAALCADPNATAVAASPMLFLGLTKAVSGTPLNILFLVGVEHDYAAMAPLKVSVLIGSRFVPVFAEDKTRGLGESGILSLSLPEMPAAYELFGKELIWIRIEPQATGPWSPSIAAVYLNAVWAVAGETMTREPLGSSDGRPGLVVQLARPPLIKGSLELRVKEPLGEEERKALLARDVDAVLTGMTDLAGDWVKWTQVNDPLDEDAGARVFALDEASGTVTFGDGMHGMIPPIGRDVVVAFAYKRIEPAADGGSDVPANQVAVGDALNLISPIAGIESVIAADHAAGGVAPETGARVLRFASSNLRHRNRAVTARDFEDIALERSAGIVQVRCDLQGSAVRLVAVKGGANPVPNAAELRAVAAAVLESAPPELSLPDALQVVGPALRQLRIALGLQVSDLALAGRLSTLITGNLKAFFDPESGGADHAGWPLGQSPTLDDIAFVLLDAPGLEDFDAPELLEVLDHDAEIPWPGNLSVNELVVLAPDGIRLLIRAASAAA